MQSLTDKKRQQIQAFNAQQSLLRDPDQTELDIFAYKSDNSLDKNDKIMLVQIHDKTQTLDKYRNHREYQLNIGRQVEIMLPYFIDRVFNIADMYNIVCHSIKLQSVSPVALTVMHNRMNIDQAFRHGNYKFSNYTILDLRDLQIDQTSEAQKAFKQIYGSQWSSWRFTSKQNEGRYNPAVIFAPQTIGNIQADTFSNESIVIWDKSGEDYVDDDKVLLKASKVPSYTGDALIVPQKINLQAQRTIESLFDGQLIAPLIENQEGNIGNLGEQSRDNEKTSGNIGETNQNQYKLDLINLLNIGENLETMDKLFKQSIFHPHNRQQQSASSGPASTRCRTTLSIDLDKLKNLKSMVSLCEYSVNINNIEITNIRPGINMHWAFKHSEAYKISLAGSIDADNMIQIFEKAQRLYQIDLSNLIINTSIDPKRSEQQMVEIFWGIDIKHTNLIINSNIYNRAPRLFKKFRLENKNNIKIV